MEMLDIWMDSFRKNGLYYIPDKGNAGGAKDDSGQEQSIAPDVSVNRHDCKPPNYIRTVHKTVFLYNDLILLKFVIVYILTVI